MSELNLCEFFWKNVVALPLWYSCSEWHLALYALCVVMEVKHGVDAFPSSVCSTLYGARHWRVVSGQEKGIKNKWCTTFPALEQHIFLLENILKVFTSLGFQYRC